MATHILPRAGLDPNAPLTPAAPVADARVTTTSEVRELSRPSVAEVYASQFDYVYRCLRSLGVTGDLTDDALQDVFMVVNDKLPDFDGRARLRTWLYAIVLRVARRYRERVAKDASRFVAQKGEPGEPGTADGEASLTAIEGEETLLHNEQLGLAQRALACLDDGKREVFVLAMIEQCSAPEIAAITGLPLNTVYSRLRAARGVFEAAVARLSRDGDTRRQA